MAGLELQLPSAILGLCTELHSHPSKSVNLPVCQHGSNLSLQITVEKDFVNFIFEAESNDEPVLHLVKDKWHCTITSVRPADTADSNSTGDIVKHPKSEETLVCSMAASSDNDLDGKDGHLLLSHEISRVCEDNNETADDIKATFAVDDPKGDTGTSSGKLYITVTGGSGDNTDTSVCVQPENIRRKSANNRKTKFNEKPSSTSRLIAKGQPKNKKKTSGRSGEEDTSSQSVARKMQGERRKNGKSERKSDPPFACNVCQHRFNLTSALVRHIKSHHSAVPEQQREALQKVEEERQKNYKRCRRWMEIPCPICGQRRYGKRALKHLLEWHSDVPDIEQITADLQRNINYLIGKHRRDCDKEKQQKSFVCKCGKEFQTPQGYHKHFTFRCPENPNQRAYFYCTVCASGFSGKEKYESHILKHKEEKTKYTCDICGLSYATRPGLLQHNRRVHNIVKKQPIVRKECHVCGATFFQTSHLSRHMATHTDQRNATCHICGKRFRHSTHLARHIKMRHHNQYPFHCSKCGHGVEKLKYLQSHICGRVRRPQGQQAPQSSLPAAIRAGQENNELKDNASMTQCKKTETTWVQLDANMDLTEEEPLSQSQEDTVPITITPNEIVKLRAREQDLTAVMIPMAEDMVAVRFLPLKESDIKDDV